MNNNINKLKTISVNHKNQNRNKNIIKSSDKKYSSNNIFSTCRNTDKIDRNQKK